MTRKLAALTVALAAVMSNAWAGDGAGFLTGPCTIPASAPMPGSGDVLRVPADHPTIQAAVDAASEGDTILIAPGEYRESVHVRTNGLRIRGEDRNGVVLNGENTREIAIDVQSDRVVLENMTAHNYKQHGFYWFGATGYWGRYLTAYNFGLYGVYAYDSRCGQFDHSYASGSADSGFYIGECFPCDAVIHDIESTGNALGYSGTNAGGNLILRDSYWHDNGLGIVPNSLDSEENPPQRAATFKNNRVENNNNRTAPGVSLAGAYWGGGIVIAGGQDNSVYGNVVTGHELGGIVLAPLPSENVWLPSGNIVWGNIVNGPGASIDLAQPVSSGPNNCWAQNDFEESAPAMIEEIWSCGRTATPPGGDPRVELELILGAAGANGRVHSPWQTWPAPPAQPNQPSDNATASYADDGGTDAWLPALGI